MIVLSHFTANFNEDQGHSNWDYTVEFSCVPSEKNEYEVYWNIQAYGELCEILGTNISSVSQPCTIEWKTRSLKLVSLQKTL